MAHADLITRCTTCRETLVIARESAQMARPITCPHCGVRFPLWQAVGRSQRELPQAAVSELGATWEGARP